MLSTRATIVGRKPAVGATATYSPPAPQASEKAIDFSTYVWNEIDVVWPVVPKYESSSFERVDKSTLVRRSAVPIQGGVEVREAHSDSEIYGV
jgi:hypothetical protein